MNLPQRQRAFKDLLSELAAELVTAHSLRYQHWRQDVTVSPLGDMIKQYSAVGTDQTGAPVQLPFTPALIAKVQEAEAWVISGNGAVPTKRKSEGIPPVEGVSGRNKQKQPR